MKMYFLLKMGIFQCHVSLVEGTKVVMAFVTILQRISFLPADEKNLG